MAREISEHDATLAVDAAAQAAYERLGNDMLQRNGEKVTPWAETNALLKHRWRSEVLPMVWAALGALPDQRHAAFEEGWAHAWTPLSPRDLNDSQNPYPAEEA